MKENLFGAILIPTMCESPQIDSGENGVTGVEKVDPNSIPGLGRALEVAKHMYGDASLYVSYVGNCDSRLNVTLTSEFGLTYNLFLKKPKE